MRERRVVIWSRGIAAAAALCLILAVTSARAAGLYGLVIGVDDYAGTANDLDGAVNDANDVAQALRRLGAREVIRLVNGEASKDRIAAAWSDLLGKAKEGDTIVFSYAGHGAQEREPPGRHDEADGLNENFLLGGFQSSGPATRERIVDDELFEWMKQADDKRVRVVLVADSCHSGGMERSANAAGVKFRKGNFPAVTDDRLTPAPAEFAKLSETDFDTVTFVGAVAEDKLTPEVTIDGKKRGALSWAFSRALEGRADKDGDGEVSEFELLGYIVPAVHALVESQQTPQVLPLRARSVPLVTLREAGVQAAMPEDTGALKLKLAVVDGEAGPLAELPYVTIVTDKAAADLIWSVADGEVEHVVGGVVAENVDAQSIKGVVSKWAALKWLKSQAALSPIEAKLVTGNQRYAKGERVEIAAEGAKYPHLTLFNLPPDGRVELFIPTTPGDAARDWRSEGVHESFKVDKPPYGAEHMVAIFSQNDLADLHAALASMNNAERAEALRPLLEATLAGQDVQIGILDIYTGAGG
jgi:hypothetical protein